MNNVKKFLCLLLVLCSLTSVAVPAMATEVPAEKATEVPAEEVTEAPAEEVTEAPAEEATEAPAEEVTEAPAEEITEVPVEDATEIPADAAFQASGDAKTYDNDSGVWYNLSWTLTNGTLSISGSGEMYQVYYSNYPWYQYAGQINKVVVGDYVTRIGYDAFAHMGNLTQVTIGSRVSSIGNEAFYKCGNLLTVTIPASVTEIEYSAFRYCGNLARVNFAPGSKLKTIGNDAFRECRNLLVLELPNELTYIGERVFQDCANLMSVTFGKKIKTIGYSAFENCDQLRDVEFPASIRTIAGRAFYDCDALISTTIPYGLQELGSYAFSGCNRLTGAIKIPGTVTSWGSNTFQYTAVQDVEIYAACAIPNYAFRECTQLAKLTIGGTVTGIGERAFAENTSLTKVALPASVTYVGYQGFADCTALSSVTFSSGLTSLGGYAFGGTAITTVKLPNSVTSIGDSCFSGCKNLTTANVGTGLTKIPYKAFSGCTSLKSVTLGNNINSIGNYAFDGCTSLSGINWPDNLNSIGERAFRNCDSCTSIVFPNALNTIGYEAFSGCDLLTSVTLAQNVTSIDSYAFEYCPSLLVFKTFGTNTNYSNKVFYNTASVTIYGWADSTADTYAESYSIPFIPITSLDTPTNRKIQNTVSGVHVYWNYVPGASYYTLYRSTSANGSYTVVEDFIPALHFTDTSAVSGKTYYYKVVAHNAQAKSDFSAYQSLTFVGTPDITSRINKAAGIQLGWDKISGATGYAIYRKSYSGNDAWVRVATITSGSTTSWTDSSVKNNNGTVYKYTVRALAGSDRTTLSGCRNTGRTMVRLCSQVMNSATKAGTNSIKCTWTTSKAVTGYEVRFVVDGKVYKTVTIGNYNTGVKTFTGLMAGQTYQIQVRTYKKVDGVGSFYSAWSTAKYVTL